MTPVKNLEERLNKCLERKTWKDRSHIPELLKIKEEYKNLTQKQLEFFVDYLISQVAKNYDLFLSSVEK